MLGCKEMRICQEPSRNSLMVVTPIDWGLDNGGGCDGLDHSARMNGRSAAVYHSVESVVCISGVGDSADSTIRLHQAVLALYYVTVPFLPLALDVTSMSVIYTVVEAVLWIRLEVKTRVTLQYTFLRFVDVHPNIKIVIFFTNLMHKFFILIHLLHSSTRFEHYCAHIQEDNCINTASSIVTFFG